MKFSTFLKQYLLLSLCSVSVLEAELLIPGEDGGPHTNKVMVFDGSLNFWANDLYGFQTGKEVVFENCIAALDLRNKPWINEKLSSHPASHLPPTGKPSAGHLPAN